jgi:D-alanine-D-alanine ligase
MLDVAVVRYFATRVSADELQPGNKKIPVHTRMRGFLRSRQESIEKLLQKAVNINTYVRNVDGVNEFGNLVRKELSLLGFSHEIIPQVEVGNQLFFSNAYDTMYDILFLGSLDNNRKISEHDYFQIQDQKLSGTGIWEHKAGIISLIAALQSLRFIRLLRKTRIGILLTTDNSLQGKFAQKIVREKSAGSDYIIGLHGGDPGGSLITSRSGASSYRFNMHLRKTGDSKLVSMAASVFSRLVNAWCELSHDDNSLVIAPYKTTLNTNIMQPYAHGEAILSVRFNDEEQYLKVEQKIRKLIPVRKYADKIHFQIEGGLRRNPFEETQKVIDFYKIVKEIAGKLDVRIMKEHRWSSSDICFVDKNKYILDGFGPVGQKEQDRLEYILRHSLLERALLISITLKEISGT